MHDDPAMLSPIVSTVPLQLLAYHAASSGERRGQAAQPREVGDRRMKLRLRRQVRGV